MRDLWMALVGVYRRWKYVEDLEAQASSGAGVDPCVGETERLMRAIAREERNVEYFRRFNCESLARSSESSLRAMKRRLQALEMNLRQAV